MLVEGIILSAFLQALFKALFKSVMSSIFDEFFRVREGKEMKVILGELETKLLTICAWLSYAHEEQITNQAVEDWVNKLKDAVYHAEDVLDDIYTEASLGKETISLKILLDKLTSVKMKLDSLASEIEVFSQLPTTPTHTKRLTTSLIGEQRPIGRQTEKAEILKLLTNDDNSKIEVLAIVGIGGVGKTTLAQLLYDEDHFPLKAWIHVSEKIDVFSLTKRIFEAVTRGTFPFEDLNQLHLKLEERLKKKKFLLVLDDMWSESFEDWNLLCQPFATAAKESRIIALGPQEHDLNRELGELAEQVVGKCQGLPLAAKVFGGLLRSSREGEYWRGILNSKIWTLPTGSINILPVLQVSYHYLPLPLKRCFAYCSIFPKGYVFEKERVVLLWMSEGLLHKDEGNTERMEAVGDEYFSELVSRSLFQRDIIATSKFTMHDLINELAQFAAGEFCFKYENQIQGMSGKTRHLSYLRDQYSGEAMKFEVLHGVKSLRTFLPLSLKDSSQTCCLNNMVRDKLLRGLTCLRVLSLSHYKFTLLPSDIFKRMRHIRYLDLSRTYLKTLPTSVGFLYNLQTLLLSYCPNLIQLEETICNLISLTYIDLTATKLNQMPKSFGKLTRLQTLTTFVVSDGKGAAISALKDLTKLRGKLAILELHRVKGISDAEEADLEGKTHLKEINFTWRTSDPVMGIISGTRNEDALFDMLRPHNKIEKLTVDKYYGNSFPRWMSDPSFSSIVYLSLSECQRCTSLPSLGRLAGLKELHISNMRDLVRIGPEFYTSNPKSQGQDQQPFWSLEMLTFEDMPNWAEWADVEVYGGTLFPMLQKLFIVSCPKLTSAPPGLFPCLLSLHTCKSESIVVQLDAPKYPRLQQLN
ncbi:putative disease resistance RPP13-like protein 1 [Brassica napus]|uniref:putative disease resistance RPP13-like protein 1 n=1 Tax=Brassica napus TaxID=3708 RepID=UPI0006AAF539|nr:putative disease resistance RPP13-like protein 1 [Brassica napus]